MKLYETAALVAAATAVLSQCPPETGCEEPTFNPDAITVPVDSPAYYTHGGFRQAQAPNRQTVGVQQNPYLTREQMESTLAEWNRVAGWNLLEITNSGAEIIFIENDSLVDGNNNFRAFTDTIKNADGSHALGRIYYDRDHTQNSAYFVDTVRHELGHVVFGFKDIYDGVSQVIETNIPQQCYDPAVASPVYMGEPSIMSYCDNTRSAVPTPADVRSATALGFVD